VKLSVGGLHVMALDVAEFYKIWCKDVYIQ